MSVNVNGNSYNGNTTRIDGAVDYYGWLPYSSLTFPLLTTSKTSAPPQTPSPPSKARQAEQR